MNFAQKGRLLMDTGREQIDLFLRRCDEVMQSKFILADTKIGELLKSIASSDLLYAFFRGDGHHLIRAAERNGLDDLASVFSDDLLFNGHISHVDQFRDLFSEDILFRDLDYLELETESYIFVNLFEK